jgi:pilus assembly protein Flp/PilA
MKQFIKVWTRLIEDESGQDLIEYALVVALIALAAISTLTSVATAVTGVFTSIAAKLTAAVPAT